MKTIKVDPATDRMIADLAHFLGRMKKDVLRDAVRMFADMQGRAISRSIDDANSRVAAVSGSLEGARVLAAAAGDLGALPLLDRVRVQRVELVALLERYGGRNPRIVGELARGGETEIIELLIESDPYAFDWNPMEATHTIQRLLDAPVVLHDAARLHLFSPERLARLEEEAIPL